MNYEVSFFFFFNFSNNMHHLKMYKIQYIIDITRIYFKACNKQIQFDILLFWAFYEILNAKKTLC